MRPHTKEYSIVDPIKSFLDEDIIQKDKIRPQIQKAVTKISEKIAKDLNVKIKKIWIVGSSLTYQWTPESDIDVTIIIENKSPEDIMLLNKELATEYNEKFYVKSHPINFHLVSNIYQKFKSDAIYDVTNDAWIKKPEALSEDDIEDLIKGCSSLNEFNEILEEYQKLKKILETFDGSQQATHDILEQTLVVSGLFQKIKDKRREDFRKKPEKGLISANHRCSNVIFKLLEQYGLNDLAGDVAGFFQSRLKN